jgi:hypothetical protein
LARRGGAADWFQRGLQTHWLSRLAAAYGSLTHQADALLAVATPAPAL